MTSPLRFLSAARTHPGRVRELNEDRFLARPEVGLWAVADGMGGHDAGEVASSLVVAGLQRLGAFATGFSYLNAVCDCLQDANRDLVARAGGGVIGSTVVALLAYEDHYACVWAGDSRAYRMRGGELSQVTHDHSMVQALVDAGALTANDARNDRRANVITRAVGAAEALELERRHAPVSAGDTFLLCSDGLTATMDDAEIAAILGDGPLDAAADDLIALALERGAPDNVTVVLVRAENG